MNNVRFWLIWPPLKKSEAPNFSFDAESAFKFTLIKNINCFDIIRGDDRTKDLQKEKLLIEKHKKANNCKSQIKSLRNEKLHTSIL